MKMSVDRISIINVQEVQPIAETKAESITLSAVKTSAENERNVSPVIRTEDVINQRINRALHNNASYWNLLHVITILGACAFSLSPQLLVPRYNNIYYPEYLHEVLFLYPIPCLVETMSQVLHFVVFTNQKSLVKISFVVKIWLCYFLPGVGLIYFTHYFWTSVMGYQHPMPFVWIFVFLMAWIIVMCIHWSGKMFPTELRMNQEFRDEIKRYLPYEMWLFFMHIQKEVLSVAFTAISADFQFLFALLIPAAKEMNKIVLSKLMWKMIGREHNMANVLLGVFVNTHYALFVATRMVGAETQTVLSIILVDTLLHLWMTSKIIKSNQTLTTEAEQN